MGSLLPGGSGQARQGSACSSGRHFAVIISWPSACESRVYIGTLYSFTRILAVPAADCVRLIDRRTVLCPGSPDSLCAGGAVQLHAYARGERGGTPSPTPPALRRTGGP